MSNIALIRYVGKQQHRRDDVRNTGRVWEKHGSVVEVPDSEKFSYLAHPAEWVEVSTAQLEAEAAAEFQARGGIDSIRVVLPSLSLDLLEELGDFVAHEIASRGVAPEDKPRPNTDFIDPGAIGKTPDQIDAEAAQGNGSGDGSASGVEAGMTPPAGASGIDALVTAIGDLDRRNPEHFTGTGQPRVSALKDLGFEDVTAADIKAAMDLIAQRTGGAGQE